jgi:glycosyltransferase involved in cell wall biosynthesis
MNKILIIGSEPKSLIQFRGKLLESLVSYNYEVVACANGVCNQSVAKLKKIGVEYQPAKIKRTSFNPFNDLIFLFQLILIFYRVKPDVILTYTLKPVIYGTFVARIFSIKRRFAMITGLGYSFTFANSFKKKILSQTVSFLYKISLAGAKTIFFQNNNDRDYFLKNNLISSKAKTCRIMGSGVDLNHYGYKELPSKGVSFLLIARLLQDKGIREYVKAAEIVIKQRPDDDITFSILGPFDSNPSSIQPNIINEWVNSGLIKYEGEAEDVRPFIAKCSVFVLPSYREGMPRSVLEAMSMGRPIITSDAPGCRDTVDENVNGFLVPVKSVNVLATAMIRCLDNNKSLVEMGLKSRKMIEKSFDVKRVNEVILREMEIL